MSHILALFLAINMVASPCLASFKPGGQSGSSDRQGQRSVDLNAGKTCKGPCAKAVISRAAKVSRVAVLPGFDASEYFFSGFSDPRTDVQNIAPCRLRELAGCREVDLFELCRQLN